EEGESKTIVGKTATLELSARSAEILALAEAMGDLSLSLRALTKTDPSAAAEESTASLFDSEGEGEISVLRYGMPGKSATTSSE
ncbi:MAG: hypothetical protein SGJ03_16495, partial [Alphaproteobacteria bacterium]|nr:hypothetical protein [Alphaproteobacteria bacterium]